MNVPITSWTVTGSNLDDGDAIEIQTSQIGRKYNAVKQIKTNNSNKHISKTASTV